MKKFCISVLVLLLALMLTVPAAAQNGEAEDLSASAAWSVSQNEYLLPNLLDSRYNTLWTSQGESSITVTSDQKIAAVYIVWDTAPTKVEIKTQNGNLPETAATGGSYGFLHEFLPLDKAVHTVEICLYDDVNRIEKIYVFGEGTIPDWVQQWEPPCEKADLLLCSTHADDEHLWFGGTMPYYGGQLGKEVQVVYLMHHVTQRNHELLDGLWTVGITNYPVIAPFEDQWAGSLQEAEYIYDRDQVQAFQTEMIRRFKPDVVVGHDLNGEYGHGAHILNAVTLQLAVENSGNADYYPDSANKYGTWTVQKCYLHLYDKGGESEIIMDWEQPLSRFDGKTGFQMAQEGFACHVSQQGYFEVAYTGHPHDCHRFGLIFTTVGADVEKNDFFENVTKTTLPQPEPEEEEPAPQPEEEPQPQQELDLSWLYWVIPAAVFIVGGVTGFVIWKGKRNGRS